MKKKLAFVIGIGMVLVALSLYWLQDKEPSPFPTDEQIISEINTTYSKTSAKTIQDTIYVDEHHVLVPFISDTDDYGLSYWAWEGSNWIPSYIDSSGLPMVWKIDRDNPASYRLAWNINPKNSLETIDFYLVRDRNYLFIEGEGEYHPRVQMVEEVFLQESYGLKQLPEEWAAIIKASHRAATQESRMFFNNFHTDPHMQVGWIPFNEAGEKHIPEHTGNINSYTNGEVYLDHVLIMNEIEMEGTR
jgi:hypothetical protein